MRRAIISTGIVLFALMPLSAGYAQRGGRGEGGPPPKSESSGAF